MVFQDSVFPDDFTYQLPFCMSTIFKQPPLNATPTSTVLVDVQRSSDQRTIFGIRVGPEVEVEYYGATLTASIPTQTINDTFQYLSVCIDEGGELTVYQDCEQSGPSPGTFPAPAFGFPSEPSGVVVGIGGIDQPFNVCTCVFIFIFCIGVCMFVHICFVFTFYLYIWLPTF